MNFYDALDDDIKRVSRMRDSDKAKEILSSLSKIKYGLSLSTNQGNTENDGFYFSKEARDIFLEAHRELKGIKVVEDGEPSLEIKVKRSIETFKLQHHETPSSEKLCVICMEEYKFGQMNVHLDCKHKFHLKCLKDWNKKSDTCPFCKAKFDLLY